MRNHFHLAVQTPEPNLSVGMKWFQGTWAVRFNRRRGEVGQPFQGRYKAIHVEPGESLLRVVDYIHLNPVRAGIATVERLAGFRWSSLTAYAQRPRPAPLDPSVLLRESGGWADNAAGWRGYHRHLEQRAAHEIKLGRTASGRLSRGWAIGSPIFRARLKDELIAQVPVGQRFELLGVDRQAHAMARADVWEARLQAVAAAAGITLNELPARKSAPEKVRLAAALKRVTSVSNRWLAERLQMGAVTSVSSLLHRFQSAGATESKTFKTILSRFSI